LKSVLTVSEITRQIKQVIETEFENISIIGEISGFKAHVSGHWYFNLKDANAVIACTMWKGVNNYVFFTPQDGMKVIITGKITVYPPRGNYQADVRSMKPAGVGELQQAFELLKQKLSEEGLFDVQKKKPVTSFNKKIGVITAIDGAAFQDMKSVAERRFPLVEIFVCPTKVQGIGAAENVVENIRELNKIKDIDKQKSNGSRSPQDSVFAGTEQNHSDQGKKQSAQNKAAETDKVSLAAKSNNPGNKQKGTCQNSFQPRCFSQLKGC